MPLVRPATPADAEAGSQLLRRSITELCITDHQNDAATLNAWLSNKTPEMFLQWLANPNNFCAVAEEDQRLLGVGMIRRSGQVSGHVNLLYLAPGAQRHGIGKAIYHALEAQAKTWRLGRLTAESTSDARAFYEAMGFRPTGDTVPGFPKARGWPYAKVL